MQYLWPRVLCYKESHKITHDPFDYLMPIRGYIFRCYIKVASAQPPPSSWFPRHLVRNMAMLCSWMLMTIRTNGQLRFLADFHESSTDKRYTATLWFWGFCGSLGSPCSRRLTKPSSLARSPQYHRVEAEIIPKLLGSFIHHITIYSPNHLFCWWLDHQPICQKICAVVKLDHEKPQQNRWWKFQQKCLKPTTTQFC